MKSRNLVGGVILAAGRSSRMGGRPKALLPHAPGHNFVSHLVHISHEAGLSPILVVGRPDHLELRAEVEGLQARFVENTDADRGQLSSLVAGIDAAGAVDAVMVLPVDVPLLSAGVLRTLLNAADRSDAAILRATSGGRHGHPVLFRRAVFDELRAADPEVGARAIVRADPARVLNVEVAEPGVTIDIDTPEDYRRVYGHDL